MTDERLTPKKVTHEAANKHRCTCPNCKAIVDTFKETANGRSGVRAINNYCPYCGQALEA